MTWPSTNGRFVQRALIVVGVVATALLVSGVLIYIVDTLLILFGAILVSLALRKLGDVIASHTGMSPFYGFLTGIGALTVIVAGSLALIGPSMYAEIKEAGPRFAAVVNDFTDQLDRQDWMKDVKQRLRENNISGEDILSLGFVPQIAKAFTATSFGLLMSLSLVFIIGFWIAWRPDAYLEIVVKLLPLHLRDHFRSVATETGEVLTNWILGRLLAMLTVGSLTCIALLVLGVPMPFTLGILAGLISFVPTIGAFLAIAPALLFTIPQGMGQVAAVLVCYTVIQLLENNVITPLVMQQAVSIPPAFVLLMQLAMGMLIGGLGVAFAVPLAAAGSVLLKRLYVQDVLGDEHPDDISNDTDQNTQEDRSPNDESGSSSPTESQQLQAR